jgi:CheY-like chemotaxis protein
MRPVRPTLLVVDDDRLLRWSIRQALRGQARVRLAASAEDALKVIRKDGKIDGALVDVKLPGMDGHEFVRRARSLRPELKVFMMTAFDPAAAPKEAFAVRAEGYLPKPFEMSLLKDMIASHLT